MKIFTIIVNYNCSPYIIDCLESLQKTDLAKFNNIIIIDNNSQDDSVQLIKQHFPKIKLIKNNKNLGFAKACNIGINYALSKKADYILLLNPDTKVNKKFFNPLIKILKKSLKNGIISPIIKDIDSQKYTLGLKYNRFTGKVWHKHVNTRSLHAGEENMVSACCMMIKAEVFKKIGLFDERFFMFFEDVDFCLRAKKAGFKIFIESKSEVLHLVSRTMTKKLSFKNKQILKSNFLFILKHVKPFLWPFSFLYLFLLSLKIIINNLKLK